MLWRVPVNGAVTVEEARSLATGERDEDQSGYIHTDLRGSTLAKTGWDAQMSLPFEEAEYGAWGETLRVSTNPVPTHQFVGFEPDPATGWYFMGARVYDPTLRRWLSPDPLLLAAPHVDAAEGKELNLYAYGRNNPVVRIDPDGTYTFLTGIPYNPYLRDKFAKATDAAATVVVETVVAGTVCAALGCNPAETPVLGEGPHPRKTFVEEAVELGTMGKFGGGGRAAGRFFSKQMDDVAGSAAKSNSKRAATRQIPTPPTLPPKSIAKNGDIEIMHYTKSGDHGPAHMHVKGGGKEIRIGQNGKPLKGEPELSGAQQKMIKENKSAIRKAGKKIGKWNQHQETYGGEFQ